MLRDNRKFGVENYKFPQARILCYTKVISNLREEGHNIVGERQIVNGRFTGVWKYFLVEEQPRPSLLSRLKKVVV